jgi:hypothetical protein
LSLLESPVESLGEEVGDFADELFMDDELLAFAFGSNVDCYELVANRSVVVSFGILVEKETTYSPRNSGGAISSLITAYDGTFSGGLNVSKSSNSTFKTEGQHLLQEGLCFPLMICGREWPRLSGTMKEYELGLEVEDMLLRFVMEH